MAHSIEYLSRPRSTSVQQETKNISMADVGVQKITRALVSVSDKAHLIDFVQFLAEHKVCIKLWVSLNRFWRFYFTSNYWLFMCNLRWKFCPLVALLRLFVMLEFKVKKVALYMIFTVPQSPLFSERCQRSYRLSGDDGWQSENTSS